MTTTKFSDGDFGTALHHLKSGGKVARLGWNGKDMFVWLEPGNVASGDPFRSRIGGVSTELFCTGDTGTVTRMPHMSMRTTYGATLTGWNPTTTDVLANDWHSVE